VNGVAHTSRHFEAFARRRNLPFLCIRAGDRTPSLVEEGALWTLEFPRGPLSVTLEKDLRFDPAFARYVPQMEEVLARFRPDLIHVTGLSELGVIGGGLALALDLPLAASWHTNVHEYAARRAERFLHLLPEQPARAAEQKIQDVSLSIAAKFYSAADLLFAPNPGLCDQLQQAAGRPCHLMPRGVDATLFHPAKRTRPRNDGDIILGYVGRLSVEKNVALLAAIDTELQCMPAGNVRFVIVGHGAEESMLRQHMPDAQFMGVLRGEALARAYADMDLFVFPSHTDTFGNVVLEALASGVPAIVTPDGGPASIVRDGLTGRVVPDHEFANAIASLIADRDRLAAMRAAARAHAESAGWDSVFEGVYAAYGSVLRSPRSANELAVQRT
jgi:glycosyltransferase involved in cell wall biosynthesis